jgi:hypothetical protein
VYSFFCAYKCAFNFFSSLIHRSIAECIGVYFFSFFLSICFDEKEREIWKEKMIKKKKKWRRKFFHMSSEGKILHFQSIANSFFISLAHTHTLTPNNNIYLSNYLWKKKSTKRTNSQMVVKNEYCVCLLIFSPWSHTSTKFLFDSKKKWKKIKISSCCVSSCECSRRWRAREHKYIFFFLFDEQKNAWIALNC